MTPHDNPVTADATDPTTVGIQRRAQEDAQSDSNLRGIFGALERLGYDLEALVAPSGLRRADLADPDKYIAKGICSAVLARAREERRVKNLPLRIAMAMPMGSNPLLDYLIASADSVREGLLRLERYHGLVTSGLRVSVREQEDPVRVIFDVDGDPLRMELTVALSVLRFRHDAEGEFRVSHASFSHEPEDVADMEEMLRCPIQTRAAWNGWAVDADSMQLPLRRRDPLLARWLERRAADLLTPRAATDTVAFEVRRLLATSVAGGDTRIDAVARQLAMTPRTLQRRLADEGTSFDALRDETRKQAAETFLGDRSLSITEVAYLLGYAEPTAFHRAFKRWHGTTAQAWRDQVR